MTVAELLNELHRQGVHVQAVAGELCTRPAGAVPPGLQPLLVQHRRGLLELLQMTCPGCGEVDYLPLASSWRRCWACGARWGAGRDPGDPPQLKGAADLLSLDLLPELVSDAGSARHPVLSNGSVLRCPRCGNRAYSTQSVGVPHRRCDGPNSCGHTWNPEASSSRAGSGSPGLDHGVHAAAASSGSRPSAAGRRRP